jgi:hypothetical protein
MLEAARKSGSDGDVKRGRNIDRIRIMGWPKELSVIKWKK